MGRQAQTTSFIFGWICAALLAYPILFPRVVYFVLIISLLVVLLAYLRIRNERLSYKHLLASGTSLAAWGKALRRRLKNTFRRVSGLQLKNRTLRHQATSLKSETGRLNHRIVSLEAENHGLHQRVITLEAEKETTLQHIHNLEEQGAALRHHIAEAKSLIESNLYAAQRLSDGYGEDCGLKGGLGLVASVAQHQYIDAGTNTNATVPTAFLNHDTRAHDNHPACNSGTGKPGDGEIGHGAVRSPQHSCFLQPPPGPDSVPLNCGIHDSLEPKPDESVLSMKLLSLSPKASVRTSVSKSYGQKVQIEIREAEFIPSSRRRLEELKA